MTIKNINNISKFRNTKLFKGITVGTCILTILSFAGCTSEKEVSNLITNDMSFEYVLDTVKDKTNLDEILEQTNYKELLLNYIEARQNKDLEKVNIILSEFGESLLKSSVCESLIKNGTINSYNDIVNFNFEITELKNEFGVREKDQAFVEIEYYDNDSKVVTGNINIENDIKKKRYELKDELFDLAYDTDKCRNNNIESLEDADNIYKSFETFIFTTGKVNNDEITNSYDEEKVKVLKK